ncbi:MAG TPA: hypothetical protein VKW08_08005 [Xanthobacteraceae bacterium]|jgi:hypothetical protein|nr:hypothetical protein [Xanthobacteraceae bacterium]
MSATVIILPVVRRPEVSRGTVFVRLTPKTLQRLNQRAKDWNLTREEAAEAIISEVLRPKERKR